MRILGVTRDIGIYCEGSIIKSFYIDNGHEVAPFVIEKKYGNGKIIFVNISGYFKTLSKYSDRFFLTLGSIADFIGLHTEKFTKTVTLNSAPSPYFIGNLNMSGPVIINSSSLLLSKNYELQVQNISITRQKSTNLFYQSPLNQTNFSNTQVRDLKIYGSYNVVINSIDLLYVPSPSSPYNYIQLHLPVGSNITIKLFNGSRAEFFIGEDNNQQPVKVSDGKIEFKGIKSGLLSDITNSIPVLMKTPEITINKKASFQAVRSNYPDDPTKPWADLWPLEANGQTTLKFEHANNDANNVTRYITYFKWIKVNTDTNKPKEPHGELLEIPWQEIINSTINTTVMVSILIISIVVSIYLLWSSSKVKKWETNR
jgi:hypothetical protein